MVDPGTTSSTGSHWLGLGELAVEGGQRRSGLHPHYEVAPGVLEHLAHPGKVDHDLGRARPASPVELGARAPGDDRPVARRRPAAGGRHLFVGARQHDDLGHNPVDGVGAHRPSRASSRGRPARIRRRAPSEQLGRAALDQRVRATAVAGGARRTGVASGGASPGCRGLRDRRRAAGAASCPRSSALNILGMAFNLSRPTPCSPVMEPPCAMHSSRISARDLLGPVELTVDAGVVQHQRMEVAVPGVEHVRHPEPGLAADSSAMARSTSSRAVRGTTPSWTM